MITPAQQSADAKPADPPPPRRRNCPICGGTGEEQIEDRIEECPACRGTGHEDNP